MLIGFIVSIVGIATLFINRYYTSQCAIPCGYFGSTRNWVIRIGIGAVIVGLLVLGVGILQFIRAQRAND